MGLLCGSSKEKKITGIPHTNFRTYEHPFTSSSGHIQRLSLLVFSTFVASADLRAKPHCCNVPGARRVKTKKRITPIISLLLRKRGFVLKACLCSLHGSGIAGIIESKAECMNDILSLKDTITISAIIWVLISLSIHLLLCVFQSLNRELFPGFYL